MCRVRGWGCGGVSMSGGVWRGGERERERAREREREMYALQCGKIVHVISCNHVQLL